MNWIWRMCITSMKQRGVRTFLTILGVVIGVISIVSLMALGIGVKEEMLASLEANGSVKRITVYGADNATRKAKMLTDRKLAQMGELEYVENVYPILNMYSSLKYGRYVLYSNIVGVPREYLECLELKNGELPKQEGSRPEVLIGEYALDMMINANSTESYKSVYKEDEERLNLSGKNVDISYYFENKEQKDKLSVSGMVKGFDYSVYLDLEQLKKYLKRHKENGKIYGQPETENGESYNEWIYDMVYVDVDDVTHVDQVMERLQDMGFQAESEKEFVESTQREIKTAQFLLGGIGMIALVVAVIGIGNSMTTSVYDRIAEIGMLKVLGCDTDDLLYLFLLESGILGGIGGLFGVILSYGVTELGVNKLAVKLLKLEIMDGMKLAIIPPWLAISAVIFAIVLGILAGFFPARWAAKLHPIEAIRK